MDRGSTKQLSATKHKAKSINELKPSERYKQNYLNSLRVAKEVGVNYSDFLRMSILELEECIKAYNNNMENNLDMRFFFSRYDSLLMNLALINTKEFPKESLTVKKLKESNRGDTNDDGFDTLFAIAR